MAEYRSALGSGEVRFTGLKITDESATAKWRVWDDVAGVPMGRWARSGGSVVLCTSPGEWMVLGDRPAGVEAVDLTHVRSAIRVEGRRSPLALSHVCALDLSESMMPPGSAARTNVAGVATEIVRDDQDGEPSFLLLMSRSFARSVFERLVAAG